MHAPTFRQPINQVRDDLLVENPQIHRNNGNPEINPKYSTMPHSEPYKEAYR